MTARRRFDASRVNAAPRCDALPYYNPWSELATRWPEIEVVVEPMTGNLLGELRYPVIALRAGTSAAQRRCTLTHEIVHLERGVGECGPWSAREERAVHAEAARRLVRCDDIARGLRELGAAHDRAQLAQVLDVDSQTLRLRLELLDRRERRRIAALTARSIWRVA